MRLRRRIAAVAVVALITLLMAEGGLRLYLAIAPAPMNSRFLSDPDCGYRFRPGQFWDDDRAPEDIVNSFGFRDCEHRVEKPPNTFRVLGIGDSFVLGPLIIDQSFLRVAERALNDSILIPPMRAEFCLMGLSGYSPENELGVLRSPGLRLDPDLVLLCLFVGNDITALSLGAEVLAGELYFTRSSNRLHNLLRKSRLFVLGEKALVTHWRSRNLHTQTRILDRAEADASHTEPDNESYSPTLYYLLIQKKRLPVFEKNPSETVADQWEGVEEVLLEFHHTCADAGIPWILLIIPTEEQVDPLVRKAVLEALSLDADAYDFDLPQRRLNRFARSHGIETLDLLPWFRLVHEESGALYIPNDTHWNRTGNRLAGELIARRIQEDHLRGDPAEAMAGFAGPGHVRAAVDSIHP
jgi:hypothetical protein